MKIEGRYAAFFKDWWGDRESVYEERSYQWLAERVEDVLGIYFAVPKDEDEEGGEGDSPFGTPREEVEMRTFEKASPELVRKVANQEN